MFKNEDLPRKKNQNSNMKISFFCKITILSLLSAAGAIDLNARDLAKYDKKLRSYQNMTGIDEETFNEIWEIGISNRKLKNQRTVFCRTFKLTEPLTSIFSSRFCTIRKFQ